MTKERILKITGGPDVGREIDLPDWTDITIGRSSKCDIQLSDRFCSSRHLRITASDHETTAIDLKSKNGIFVNLLKTDQAKLENRETIKLGNTQMQLIENPHIEAMQYADELADEFEEKWTKQSINSISQIIESSDQSFRAKTIDALVDVDVELRLKSGTDISPELYQFLGTEAVERVKRLLRFNTKRSVL